MSFDSVVVHKPSAKLDFGRIVIKFFRYI